jgi:di/tricarboxylate transporter
MVLILLVVSVASAFINNTPVVVLFIPIVLSLSCEYEMSPSKVLIPVSYASILAGTCTLIGTSTNIIVKDLSEMYGYGGIGMFELSTLGVPIAILGIVFMLFAGPYLMPDHAVPICEIGGKQTKSYLAELLIPENSDLIGKNSTEALLNRYPSAQLYEVIRNSHIYYPHQNLQLKKNDLLLMKGSVNDFVSLLEDRSAELPHEDGKLNLSLTDPEILMVELIIPPQSSLLGQPLIKTRFAGDPDIHVIAVKRRQEHYSEQKLRHMRLKIGDIILVRGKLEVISRLRNDTDFIVVEDVHHEILHKRKAKIALSVFGAMVTAATSGIADIMLCALSAVFIMILSGCLQLRDAYKALRADVLMIIVGTIALGIAMEKTGTSKAFAEGVLGMFSDLSPQIVLGGVILLSSIGTQLLSNNATAVLLIPIAISTALSLGLDPKPFIIGVCFGASACFATPIGYQTNLMVYGPGSYRFVDYLKMGIPLNIMVLILGTLFIPVIWPF